MARRAIVPQSGETILVVDDQEETLASVSNLLQRAGHKVLTSRSAEHALALFKQNEVDLLLVDYMMPRSTGADLVREIRALDPFVQIILQTGYTREQPPHAVITDMDIQGYHHKADGPEKLLLWVCAGLKGNRLVKRLRGRFAGHTQGAADVCILVVGDVREVSTSGIAPLVQQGQRVIVASHASEGVDLFSRERPDILIVDRSTLEARGGEFLQRVRLLEDAVPVILCGRGLDAELRRQLLTKFDLHAILDPESSPGMLPELVASALNSIRRVRNTCAAQELRELIVAKLCHELRNSLHVIHGYAEILRGGAAGSAADEVLDRIELASDSALRLAQDYVDLARLDAPGVMVRSELADITALVEDLHELSRRQIGSRPVRFTTNGVLPDTCLLTDAEKLRAILAQLLSNAIKFTLSGEISLSIVSMPGRTDFVLRDAGPGIDEDARSRVLSPTAKFRNDVSATTPGQGLGLAIALRLSALLGASLTTQPDARGGAVFTLSLPVAISLRTDTDQPTLH